MSLSPESVADAMYNEFDCFQAPSPLSAAILEFARKIAPEYSDLTIADEVLPELPNHISALLRRQQEAVKLEQFCPYEVLADSNQIVGFSYPRPGDSSLKARIRLVAPEVPKMLKVIRGLSPRDFELLCKRILDLLGAEETITTQYAKDGGIDFLGWLCLPETLVGEEKQPPFRGEFRLLVLGQAKRYTPSKPVGVEHVRALVGAAAAFHHDQLAPWPSKLQLPSVTLMTAIRPIILTTGRISRDARVLAKRCGVVTKGGVDISMFLSLEGIGITGLEDSPKPRFEKARFFEWLRAKVDPKETSLLTVSPTT